MYVCMYVCMYAWEGNVKAWEGQRGICGEHLYAHFWEDDHGGLNDVMVQIIDITDARDPTYREAFRIEKLKCYTPLGLNLVEM